MIYVNTEIKNPIKAKHKKQVIKNTGATKGALLTALIKNRSKSSSSFILEEGSGVFSAFSMFSKALFCVVIIWLHECNLKFSVANILTNIKRS